MINKKDATRMTADVAKGFVVGSSMLIPGCSGGTVAIILGIYARLLHAVSNLRKEFKKNIFFLLRVAVGGLLGVALLANPILTLYERYTFIVTFLIVGIIAGSVPMLARESRIIRFRPSYALYFLLGAAIVVGIGFFPAPQTQEIGQMNGAMLLLAGFLAAVALVLPGISVTFVLLIMGMYQPIMEAVANRGPLAVLVLFGVGLAIGIIVSAKALDKLLKRFYAQTYMVIFGFLAGSVWVLVKELSMPNAMQAVAAVIIGIAAFFAVKILTAKAYAKEQAQGSSTETL